MAGVPDAAIITRTAGSNGRDYHPIPYGELADCRAELNDGAHCFVAQNAPGLHSGNISLKNVEIGATNGGDCPGFCVCGLIR